MANFLEALGDTLLMGNALAGRARAEQRQKEIDARTAEAHEENMRAALEQRARQRVEDLLSAGPGSQLNPAQVAEVEKAGFGHRVGPNLQDAREIDPNVVVPIQIQGEGGQVLPTFDQRRQISADERANQMHGLQIGDLEAQAQERGKVAKFRELIAGPGFWNLSPENRDVVWAQANYQGKAPLSWDTMKERLQFEHGLEMEKVNAQVAGQERVANVRANRGLTPGQEISTIRGMRRDLLKETSSARELTKQFGRMKAGLGQALETGVLNPSSQAILVTFQKILDEDSVVRESEYARSAQGLAAIDRLRGFFIRMGDGGPGVPPERLKEFVSLAEQFVINAQKSAKETVDITTSFAIENGLDPRFITQGIGLDLGNESNQGPQPTNPPPGNQSSAATPTPTTPRFTLLPPGQ